MRRGGILTSIACARGAGPPRLFRDTLEQMKPSTGNPAHGNPYNALTLMRSRVALVEAMLKCSAAAT